MNYSPWEEIKASGFNLPAGQTVADLTPKLLSLLGSTDGLLRDELALEILCTWMHLGYYQADELSAMAGQLLNNLQYGLGQTEDDSVFLRSFSILVLAQMIALDTQQAFLSDEEHSRILQGTLTYFASEADWRGYVEDKGWAHALAHSADLFGSLVKHPQTGIHEVSLILQAIGDKVKTPARNVMLAEEDERLAKAVTRALRRELLTAEFLSGWLLGIAEPPGDTNWRALSRTMTGAVAYRNTKGFLRSLYFQCKFLDVPGWEQLLPQIEAALKQLDIYIYKNK